MGDQDKVRQGKCAVMSLTTEIDKGIKEQGTQEMKPLPPGN